MKKRTLTVMLGFVFLFGAAVLCLPKLKDKPITSTVSSQKATFPTATKSRKERSALKEEPPMLTFGLRANFEQPTTNQ